ncbi:MAG: hypothetical protein IT561_10105 [Alphaproteobacteria bacterium]|nr:hypothetical protein [Alphaproteobacteria bacterium]
MVQARGEEALEFLLAFDGRTHWYEGGYFMKFAIRRSPATGRRPHGLRYSLTLHGPDGRRLMGFDNAHGVAAKGARFQRRVDTVDHGHRTEDDPGRPYTFSDVETLIEDFFSEAERILRAHGIPLRTVATGAGRTRS